MSDLLVKLYDLPANGATDPGLAAAGIVIKRAIAPEKHVVLSWVAEKFSKGWASECDAAFANSPCSCFVALRGSALAGFACYDATARGYFGPIGVDPALRKSGLGKALTLRTLEAMREAGYGYAVIGWAASPSFFAKVAGAVPIPGSDPGIYRNMLKG